MTAGRTITGVVHGEAKVGKTWLGDTTPAPRLILDAEGGNRFTPSAKTWWNPLQGPPPEADGTWETCIVNVTSFQLIELTYQWLVSGQHPFASVVWDHVTEIQKKGQNEIAGMNPLDQQDWGLLLIKMETMMRQYRDLTMHPQRPLESVIFLAASSNKDGKFRPHVQGQLTTTMPYLTDFIGYMFVQADADGNAVRKLLVSPHVDSQFLVGDRTGRLPAIVDYPNVEQMLDTIYGPRQGQEASA